MKIALCLSGQPRGLIKAYQYVSASLLTRYKVDIFCHSWYQNEQTELSLILKLYNPKSFLFEKDWQLELKRKNYNIASPLHPAYYTFSAYKSIMESIKLKKIYEKQNNFTYDCVIRSRYDYALNKKFIFENEDMNKIHFPFENINGDTKPFYTDQFAFSNSTNMDIYSMVYCNIDDYHDSGCRINGEDLLNAHLIKNNFTENKLKFHDVNHPFFGGPYNYGPHSLVRDDIKNYLK